MYETLLRPLEMVEMTFPSADDLAEKLKAGEVLKENRRLRQIETARGLKRKHDAVDADDPSEVPQDGTPSTDIKEQVKSESPAPGSSNGAAAAAEPKITLSKSPQELRGHTSYLTFATLLPKSNMTSAQ